MFPGNVKNTAFHFRPGKKKGPSGDGPFCMFLGDYC